MSTLRLKQGQKGIQKIENSIKDFVFVQLLRYSEKHPNLKKINVGCNDIYVEGAITLSESLVEKTQLEVIELGIPNGRHFPKAVSDMVHGNKIGLLAAQQIFQALGFSQTVQYLGLCGVQIFDAQQPEQIHEISDALCKMLSQNQSLLGLDVSQTGIGNDGATNIFKGILTNQILQSLEINQNNITHTALTDLANILASERCSLSYLSMNSNPISAQGANMLALGLQSNSSITHLSLEDCQLKDEGVAVICEILSRPTRRESSLQQALNKQNSSLDLLKQIKSECESGQARREIVVLNFDGQRFSKINLNNQIARSISPDSLQQNKTNIKQQMSKVQSLNFASNQFGPKEMKYICKLIQSPLQVRVLNLKNNHLNANGAKMLANALINNQYELGQVIANPDQKHIIENMKAVNQSLTSLNLQETGIDDDGFVALAFALAQLPNISFVNLQNNYIGDKGGSIRSKFVMQSTSLTTFNLQNNQISHQTITQIQQLLDKNKERIAQSGPQKMHEQNAELKKIVKKLPIVLEDLQFLRIKNRELEDMRENVFKEYDDVNNTFTKLITNLVKQGELAQNTIQKLEIQLYEVVKQQPDMEKLQVSKQVHAEQLAQLQQSLSQDEQLIKSKETEIKNISTIKQQKLDQLNKELQSTTADTQKIKNNQKMSVKLIEQLRVKFPKIVNTVTSSPMVSVLTFSMEYANVIDVLERMLSVQNGASQVSQPTGYDMQKAAAAGSAGRDAKKSGKK